MKFGFCWSILRSSKDPKEGDPQCTSFLLYRLAQVPSQVVPPLNRGPITSHAHRGHISRFLMRRNNVKFRLERHLTFGRNLRPFMRSYRIIAASQCCVCLFSWEQYHLFKPEHDRSSISRKVSVAQAKYLRCSKHRTGQSPAGLLPMNDQKSIAAISQRAVRDLLDRLNLSISTYERDYELERRVKETIRSWDAETLLSPYLSPAIILTITAFSHIRNFETRVHIALFGVLVIAMDDPAVLDSVASRDFHRKLCTGALQSDPNILGEFTRNLAGMWDHFPPFSASSIFTSALQFVNGCILERAAQKEMQLSSDALPFITYRRNMSGLAEAFGYFIWEKDVFPDVEVYMQAIPDIIWYQNHVNDILSFYKEELAGEKGNYMGDRAITTGKPTLETIRDVIDETIIITERIRKILGEGPAREAWESFAKGWISYHTSSARYRLRELIECQYITIDTC
ncbi:terpene cyclase [Taiwanofungus camphoratus]|nr:terpene cyclase [Antrodia cinnamomea]